MKYFVHLFLYKYQPVKVSKGNRGKKIAMKVLGKYENDNTWLGGKGYRTEDEWPVAYHGTKELNVLEILRKGFLLRKGVRFYLWKGNLLSERKMEQPWPGLHLVDINPLEWNLTPKQLRKWPFGGGKKSQTKLIEEERCAQTAENSNSDLGETGDELADFNPDHVPKTILLELPFVDEEEVNENGNEGVEENNNMEEEIEESIEEDMENQQEEQMEMDNFYGDYEEFGGDEGDENVVNEAVEDGPQNIIETATTQQRIANWEKAYNNQEMELDRTPCCSNSLPKTPSSSSAKQQNNNDPYEKFNELKRQLCELIKMPYDGKNTFTKEKIERFLAIPNEEQNEESENEENLQQKDQHQLQANEKINKNSNEISESDALKICFGNFCDDDGEEDDADGNDSHGIQKHNSIERIGIGNLLLERPKMTLPKIKVDRDEDNPPPIEIQSIINEVSNQQEHIVGVSSMGQIDENVEEIEQKNQRKKKKKNDGSDERIEKKKRKRQENPQRVQEEKSSHQSSHDKNSSSPQPATHSRHAQLQQAFPAAPPTPNLINAGPSTNINFGVDAQPRCKFFSANKICREGENCLFYHDRSDSTRSKEIQRKNDGNCVYYFGRGFCFKGNKCTFLHGDMPTRGSELRNKRSAVFNELMSISTKSTIHQSTSPKLPPPPPAGLIPPPPPVPPKISLSSQQLLEGEMKQFWTSFSSPRPQPPQISLPQETEISHSAPPPPLPHQRIALSQQLLQAEMSPEPSSVILASSSSATSSRKREHRRHRSSSRSHHSRRSPPPRGRSQHRHSSVHRHRSRSWSDSISPSRKRRSRSRSRVSSRHYQPAESARRSLRRRSRSDESISPIRTHRSRSRSRISIRHIQPTESNRRSRSRSRGRTQIIIELSSDDDEQQSNKPQNSDANTKYSLELPPQHDEFVRRQPNTYPYQHRMVLPVDHKSFTKPELRLFVEDCPHFVLNGWCGWNQNCRYSHGDAEPTRGYQNAVKALTHRQLMDSSLSQGVPPLTIPSRNDQNASSAVNNDEAPTTSRRERSRSRSRH